MNLLALHLDNNQLTDLPPEIRNLTGLGALVLGGNAFTTLPPEIDAFTQLDTLDLRANQLQHVPLKFILSPTSLNLYVDGNPLDHVPESLLNDGNGAILRFLRQPEPRIVTRAFWMTVIAAPVTLVVGA
jgi:Leucine-rich repeat (LRR) protein